MTQEEILDAMEAYGLTLRRLMPEDEHGRERKPGWVVKITGGSHWSMVLFDLERFTGDTASEAVEKAVRYLVGSRS